MKRLSDDRVRVLALLHAVIGFQPAPRPCSTPDHRQFDFWVGDWDVKLANGQVAGRSINAFAPGKKWHQIWLGSDGLLMHLAGTFHGDTLTLEGVTTTLAGQSVRHRLSFTRDGARAGVDAGECFRVDLYQTTPADPLTLAGVTVAFVVAGMLACIGPAWRATTVDPMLALRAD